MVEYLTLLVVGLVFGLIGSIICVYYPEVLSKNIDPLTNEKRKKALCFVSTIGSVLLIMFYDPKTLLQWSSYLFAFFFYLIAWVDGYAKVIPNRLLIVLVFISGISLWIDPDTQKVYAVLFFVAFCILVFLIGKQFTSKKYVGWGDVKLVSVVALFTGWEFIMIIYIGIMLAGIFIVLGVFRKKLDKNFQVPLAPFFCSSYIVTLICPINMYLTMIYLQY